VLPPPAEYQDVVAVQQPPATVPRTPVVPSPIKFVVKPAAPPISLNPALQSSNIFPASKTVPPSKTVITKPPPPPYRPPNEFQNNKRPLVVEEVEPPVQPKISKFDMVRI